jgi:hypothetical protein
MIYVTWERPRRWTVRLYGPYVKGRSGSGYHSTIGIVALSVDRAIAEAQRLHPEYRIESVNDTGEVTSVVDSPELSVNGTGDA